jgi:hypothetical protein
MAILSLEFVLGDRRLYVLVETVRLTACPTDQRHPNSLMAAFVAVIHVFATRAKDVDGRDKPGHERNLVELVPVAMPVRVISMPIEPVPVVAAIRIPVIWVIPIISGVWSVIDRRGIVSPISGYPNSDADKHARSSRRRRQRGENKDDGNRH